MTHNLPTQDFPKWQRVLDNHKFEAIFDDWSIKGAIRISGAHSYAKRVIRYMPDNKDYWQCPLETSTINMGDCEDFSIYYADECIKYGCPPDNVEILIGHLARTGTHSVARITLNNGLVIIMCNMQDRPMEEAEYMRLTGFKPYMGCKLDKVINYTVKEETA